MKYNNWQGFINEYLRDNEDVTEIETNGTTSAFIKKAGKRVELENVFDSPQEYTHSIVNPTDGLVALIKQLDEKEFLAEGRLRVNSTETARVHIVLPPAVDYPQVTIARKSASLGTLDSLERSGSFDTNIHTFLEAAVSSNCTIVFSGGTGAGKTTILEALTKFFKNDDRIGVVEDVPELRLIQPNVTYLHSTLWKPGRNVNDVASLSWCVQQLNRQRVDKIIVGETRGKEFADFIVAANSGCPGSLTTIHANNSRTALQKMGHFIILGTPQPIRLANESIAQTIDFVVQLGRSSRGEHKILSIDEISDTLGNGEYAQIATNPVYIYHDEENMWEFKGYIGDKMQEKFKRAGYNPRTFQKESGILGKHTGIPVNKFRFSK